MSPNTFQAADLSELDLYINISFNRNSIIVIDIRALNVFLQSTVWINLEMVLYYATFEKMLQSVRLHIFLYCITRCFGFFSFNILPPLVCVGGG